MVIVPEWVLRLLGEYVTVIGIFLPIFVNPILLNLHLNWDYPANSILYWESTGASYYKTHYWVNLS